MKDKVPKGKKHKIGFISLVSTVINAQLGASIFLLPAVLAPFGYMGMFGWVFAGMGAILLTMVLANLCAKTGKQGGPHLYTEMFFGNKVGFYVTWMYWWVSWACNPILIATAVNYLFTFVGIESLTIKLILEVGIVLVLTTVNTLGVKMAGKFDIVLTILKVVPLIAIPIIAFSSSSFSGFGSFSLNVPEGIGTYDLLSKATLLTFWGFVGLESGASPSKFVKNPKRTVPLAIVLGTTFVAIICFVNTLAVFGVIPIEELAKTEAPLAKILCTLLGNGFEKVIGIMTFIMCAGSLNSWVMFSGQISSSAANEKIFPKIFGRVNKYEAPYFSLWISAIGTIVLLILQKTSLFGDKIEKFIDMSVIIYILIYMSSVACYIKFVLKSKNASFWNYVLIITTSVFCLFLVQKIDMKSIIALVIILASGYPIFRRLKIKFK